MPRIFDNIEQSLLPALNETLLVADHADFCVGYFNLRGWKQIDQAIEAWSGGPGHCCRLLVGMQRPPEATLREAFSFLKEDAEIDNQRALVLKKRLAQEFKDQLTFGIPTSEDEGGLRRLAQQLRDKKVIVKLFVRHPLHAKLYLLFRPDPVNPTVGFVGSSNLTLAGLRQQGELNVDVMDHDACAKLASWFEARWADRFCVDISNELVQIIEQSWAREEPVPPYHVYLKIAYHLSQEARAGLAEFRVPADFGNKLLEFQTAAVKIAAHHLNKRGAVLLGDVVGLGKTLMATALARIFEDDQWLETLILCPKNLVTMWEDYREKYRMRAKVLPISKAIRELPETRRYRIVLIDESHNLRNREGKRWRVIRDYIERNESRVILLSATPYNKTYLDLAGQLGLVLAADTRLPIEPEQLLRQIGRIDFERRHQCLPNTLSGFEKSEYPDDWRELMRLYMVRRTRSFIKENYAETDPDSGRKYLLFEDGSRSYFPDREPRRATFTIDDQNPTDQFARLYSDQVVGTINLLSLPRYGLGNYVAPAPGEPPTTAEAAILHDLSRAGKRLMGFCRTNLFKRLESSGHSFLLSVERHLLRNFVYLHAIENDLPLPIGTQDSAALDTRYFDGDSEEVAADLFESENGPDTEADEEGVEYSQEAFQRRAEEVYRSYAENEAHRFKWLKPGLFVSALHADLLSDSFGLLQILKETGRWRPEHDRKLESLRRLVGRTHSTEKVLVFSQYADTVDFLTRELQSPSAPGSEPITDLAGVSGNSEDPTRLAWRFSPVSNEKRDAIREADELRVLIATDVLSEGQNLQDCAVVINYDLPWAIIRLIQRVGRVDRIGQQAESIRCYSFLPAEGVERIIRLRSRVRQRLHENAEVVGTDEAFFEDDSTDQTLLDLYTEKSGLLDGETDTEVDLASYAYQIWKNAVEADPSLAKVVPELPNVVFATRRHEPSPAAPPGVLVYMRTAEDNDALAWVGPDGANVTQSQLAILNAARCEPDTPALPRRSDHHELVAKGAAFIVDEERSSGGGLGRPSGARFRTYERLKAYAGHLSGSVFDFPELHRAIDQIYQYPLRPGTVDTLNRQLRAGIDDHKLAELVIALYEEGRLCLVSEDERTREPQIVCSMGLAAEQEA